MLSRSCRVLVLVAIASLAPSLLAGLDRATPARVEGGLLQGTVEDGLRVYRGIPYAAPPIRDLRWRPPQPAPKWQGVRAADQFGRACIQTNSAIENLPSPSEDCLYLNVWTPAKSAREKRPVLVWIHGGGFVAGAPAEKIYHGEWLAKKGVVVVSIAYRLGVFGFLAHPELSAESPQHVSGNYGLLDMIAGLRWVQKNISAFGGDPKRVTIQGESAGAAAVSILCASPLTKGLFRGAIAESGGSFGPVRADASFGESEPLASAEKRAADWLSSAGVSNIAELRKIPAEKLQTMIPHHFGWARPNADGWVIAGDQYKLYESGHYNDVPVLVGYNSDEGLTFGSPKSQEAYVQSVRERYQQLANKILDAYPGGETLAEKRTARNLMRDSSFGWNTWVWARLQTKTSKSRVFVYYFDEKAEIPAESESAGYGARHASELPYVFRQLTEHGRPAPTPKDEALSEMMRTYWTNFVKTGDPNGAGLPKWPAYNDAKPQMLHIEAESTKAGPWVNEDGLKALDAYFEWRRMQGAETKPDDAQASGIAVKKPVFGGACKICPWGALGEIVQRMMRPYGYDVQMCYNCNRTDAPRIVAEARVPPHERDQGVSAILSPPNAPGLGPVDFGATTLKFLVEAYRGTGVYAGEKPRTNLRLIANIQEPSYVLVAVKQDTGITDLAQVKQKRWPVRVLIAGVEGNIANSVLEYYGLTRTAIEAAGGQVGNSAADRDKFDIVIGGGGGMTTAPEWSIWSEVSQKFDLVFLELPQELLAKLSHETGQDLGLIPIGLYRGIDHPLRTLVRTGTVVYGRADMPDEFAYVVAKAIDEQQDQLQWSHLQFSYNVHNVWKANEVPLHPGAARYYKEMGYMK